MPRTTREWAIRKVKFAAGNMEKASTHLDEVGATYAEQHPEISLQVAKCMEVISSMYDMLVALQGEF
jgi:hypothetical protein